MTDCVPTLAVFLGPAFQCRFCRSRGSLDIAAPAKTRYSVVVPRRMFDAPTIASFEDPIETAAEKQADSKNPSADLPGDEE
jgi:hypothetical protein